jgi:uncharacterized protein YgiB involved in biofilm formation
MRLGQPKFLAWLSQTRSQDRSGHKKATEKKYKTAPTFPTQNNIKTKTKPPNCANNLAQSLAQSLAQFQQKHPIKMPRKVGRTQLNYLESLADFSIKTRRETRRKT